MSDRIALSFSTNLRHPFLIASREGLGNLKQKVQSPPLSDYYARLVAWLTEHADQPLPDCPPGGLCSNFSDFDARAHLLSNMALSGAVAWWCDGNSKWLQAASAALAKLAEWEYWRSPWHLPLPCDLTSGFTSMGVGLAYDLLYEQLDEPLRVKVQDAIIKHGTTYIMPDEIDRQWWSYAHDGNWSYHTSGNLGLAALSIYPERPEVLPAIETAAGHIERSLDHIHPDGGWREGPGYGIGTMQSARLFIDALANAGDGQLAAHPGPSLVDDFFLFTMITPDRQAYFGDCGVKASVSPVLYRQAALGRRGDLQYLADQCGADGPLSILWRDPTVIPQPPHFEPASRYWPQCNWAVLRSSWEDPYRVVLATKAGTTAGGHQHPDCGTFLLSAYGKELISEPGIGTYSRDYHRGRSPIKSSTTHNCLLFDGKAEQVAREFKGGVISQFVTRPTYDAIKMDLFAGTGYGPHHKETEGLPTRVVRMAREKVAAVREAVGPDVDLAVDLHGRLCPADAIRMGLALAPYDLMFLEEPVPPENIDALEMVARALPMPIASGERLNTKYGFRELLNRRAVAIAQPDVVVAGGILETKKIAAMAEANYISVAPHNPNGPIATAMSVQVAACIPNLLILEFLGFPNEERMSRALLQNPLWPENGYIRVPTGPGLGIALKEEALDQFPYQVCDATR